MRRVNARKHKSRIARDNKHGARNIVQRKRRRALLFINRQEAIVARKSAKFRQMVDGFKGVATAGRSLAHGLGGMAGATSDLPSAMKALKER
jgi:hypothetical protein